MGSAEIVHSENKDSFRTFDISFVENKLMLKLFKPEELFKPVVFNLVSKVMV